MARSPAVAAPVLAAAAQGTVAAPDPLRAHMPPAAILRLSTPQLRRWPEPGASSKVEHEERTRQPAGADYPRRPAGRCARRHSARTAQPAAAANPATAAACKRRRKLSGWLAGRRG